MAAPIIMAAVRAVSNAVSRGALPRGSVKLAKEVARATDAIIGDSTLGRIATMVEGGQFSAATRVVNQYTTRVKSAEKRAGRYSRAVSDVIGDKEFLAARARGRAAAGRRARYNAKEAGLTPKQQSTAYKQASREFNEKASRYGRAAVSGKDRELMLEQISTGNLTKADETVMKVVRRGMSRTKRGLENPTNDPGFQATVRVPRDAERIVYNKVIGGVRPGEAARELFLPRTELQLHQAGERKRLVGEEVRQAAKAAQPTNKKIDILRNALGESDDDITQALEGAMDYAGNGEWVDEDGVLYNRGDIEELGEGLVKIEARGIYKKDPLDVIEKMGRGVMAKMSGSTDAFMRGLEKSLINAGLRENAPTLYAEIMNRAKSMSAEERTTAAGNLPNQGFFSSDTWVVMGLIESHLRVWGIDRSKIPKEELYV